jgi:hypothetical protein
LAGYFFLSEDAVYLNSFSHSLIELKEHYYEETSSNMNGKLNKKAFLDAVINPVFHPNA